MGFFGNLPVVYYLAVNVVQGLLAFPLIWPDRDGHARMGIGHWPSLSPPRSLACGRCIRSQSGERCHRPSPAMRPQETNTSSRSSHCRSEKRPLALPWAVRCAPVPGPQAITQSCACTVRPRRRSLPLLGSIAATIASFVAVPVHRSADMECSHAAELRTVVGLLAQQLRSAVPSASAHHAASSLQEAAAAQRLSDQKAAMVLAAMKHHLPRARRLSRRAR
jgi:hypothetical protein